MSNDSLTEREEALLGVLSSVSRAIAAVLDELTALRAAVQSARIEFGDER